MKTRLALSLALAMALVFQSTSLGFAESATPRQNPLKNIAVTDSAGNLTNATFSVTRFVVHRGQVAAEGVLRGTLNGKQVNQTVRMPVTTGQHSCQILNLTLGPLDLNLLGLRVQLSQVNLDITAEQGSGNLLGNLLCEVAKLLDGEGRAVGRLVNLLNRILGALG